MSIRRRCTKWRASRARFCFALERAFGKAWIEQAEQAVEGRFITAVRGGGQQDQMPRFVVGKTLEQFKPLLPALVRPDAGVRLVDDDQRRARRAKLSRRRSALM